MSRLWAAALVISVIYGLISTSGAAVGEAALEGAPAAVEFILATGGLICLWSGVLEILRRHASAPAVKPEKTRRKKDRDERPE